MLLYEEKRAQMNARRGAYNGERRVFKRNDNRNNIAKDAAGAAEKTQGAE